MNENYKLQNTNYKQITNYKLQITNKVTPFGHIINAFGERDVHELHELTRIAGKKHTGKITTKGSHGLHRGSFKLQTMTALIKSFCGGVQGGQFFQKAPPLAAGGQND
jgi:hypothetical protein